MGLCDCNYVILRTTRARCALNKEILDLLIEESVSGEHSGRLTYKFTKKFTASVLKGESTAKVSFNFFGHIHM